MATGVSPEQRAALEAALIPHLGPIARVMVDRVAREAPDWGTACQTLSASIPDHISREDFLRTLSGPSQLKAKTAVKAATRQGTLARPAPPPQPPKRSPSRPMSVEPGPPARTRGLVEEDLHRAEQALSRSLGPVARALVKRAARNAATPQELYASLAAELPEGPERERFLATQPD
jgi:serine/threonine-protein kinase